MMTPGSPAERSKRDASASPSTLRAEPFGEHTLDDGPLVLPVFEDKQALRDALHRDFDDIADVRDGDAPSAGTWSSRVTSDTTLPPPKTVTPWRPAHYLTMGLLIVAVAQAPLWWAFSEAKVSPDIFTCADLGTLREARMTAREKVRLELRCNPTTTRSVETFLRAEDKKIPDDAQVVELEQPEAIDPQPVETKFLSSVTTRTPKETRAEVVANKQQGRGAGTKAKTPAREAPPTAASPEPTSAKPDAEVAKPDQVPTDAKGEPDKAKGAEDPQVADIVDNQKGDTGTVKPRSIMDRGNGGGGAQILMPVGSSQSTLDNIMALQGGSDHLPDVEPGERTVLNADSYKYADFFYAVKRAVERQWRPSDLYLRRDPTGQVYGVKDRYTVLRVELDRSGKVLSIITSRPSGLDFMDEEARRAFRDAQPFVNPPLGLADADGVIRFEFGFYFEITGGKRRYNWRRL